MSSATTATRWFVLSVSLDAALAGCMAARGSRGISPEPDAALTTGDITQTVADVYGSPVAGATVCLIGASLPSEECATSASDGTYTLHLASPDGLLQVAGITTADGYLGRENLFFEDSTQQSPGVDWVQSGWGLYPTADAIAFFATRAQFTYPTATTGFVRVQVFGVSSSDFPAATATISAATAAVYFDPSGTPNPLLNSTSATALGNGFLFGNLARTRSRSSRPTARALRR